jgi:hypothetical protein
MKTEQEIQEKIDKLKITFNQLKESEDPDDEIDLAITEYAISNLEWVLK